MQEPGSAQTRLDIPFLEGVNNLVDYNVGKNTEFLHVENARSKTIGSIEKRGGQTVLGVNENSFPFVTTANYSIFSFQNDINQGFYRISVNENPLISINVIDDVFASGVVLTNPNQILPLTINSFDSLTISEQVNNCDNTVATIYYLNGSNQWVPLTGKGTNIPGGIFDSTYGENQVYLANGNAANLYVDSDTVTVVDSENPTGNLYNSPTANKVNYYKSRLYLADYYQFGIRYPTTILRSSYAMGIISLVNNDTTISMDNNGLFNYASAQITLGKLGIAVADELKVSEALDMTGNGIQSLPNLNPPPFPYPYSTSPLIISIVNGASVLSPQSVDVTDTTYFYTDSGANLYEIRRGGELIGLFTVTQITETSLAGIFTAPGAITELDLQAADEIWIAGTFEGKKIFRWVNNSSISGRDVKQYDTFKLSGGENDPITMMTNVGNIMFVSNKGAINSWNDYTIENFDIDVGCVSKKGYVKMIGTLYFIHYTGIYATGGTVPQLISNKIEKYITGATKEGKENSCAGKKGRSIFFTLGDVTLYNLDGSIQKIVKDVCVEYNLIQENWFIHSNVKATEFATFVESTDSDRLELADSSGNHAIKEFLSESLTDDGDNIHFRVDTQKLTLQPYTFENSSKPVSLLLESERGSAMQAFADFDNKNEYYPLEGNIKKGLSVLKFNNKSSERGKPPICRLVSLSIRDSSIQRCKISRMSVIFIPTVEESRDNDDDT